MASDFKRQALESTSFTVTLIKIKEEPTDCTFWDEDSSLSPEHRWIKSEPFGSVHCPETAVQKDTTDSLPATSTTKLKQKLVNKADVRTSDTAKTQRSGVMKTRMNKIKTGQLRASEEITNFNIEKEVKTEDVAQTKRTAVQPVSIEISIDRVANDCPICSKEFPNTLKLRRHKLSTCSAHSPKDSLVKNECMDSTDHAETTVRDKGESIEKGDNGAEQGSSKVPCPVCSKMYLSNKLQRHLRRTHPPESCTVSCHLCERQFKSQQFLAYHLKVSHQPNDASYYCKICSKHYTSQHNFKVHTKIVHPPKTLQVQCKACSKYFKSKQYLRLHMGSVHAGTSERTNCAKCSKRFKSRSHLAQHMKNVHQQFRCCICRIEFENRQELEAHAAAKHFRDGSIVICNNCSRTYPLKAKLVQHLRLNQCRGVKCKCHVCGRELRSKICLRRHILAVHKLSPEPNGSNVGEKKTLCRLCEFSCRFKLELKRHMDEVHSDLHAAEDLNDIPLSMNEIIHLPVDEFNELLTKHDLSEAQLSLVRDVRRRGKNKLTAQNYRKRKLEKMTSLSDEVQMVRDRIERLRQEQRLLLAERQRVRDHLGVLYQHISQNLRDEDGAPLPSEGLLLQQATDGSVAVAPQNQRDLQATDNEAEFEKKDHLKLATHEEFDCKKENYEQ